MSVTVGQRIIKACEERISLPVAASTYLYEGTMFFKDANGRAAGGTGTGANRFGGIVAEEVDNSSGSAGDKTLKHAWQYGRFELQGSGFTQADVGKVAYATDNFTITVAPSASAVPIGVVAEYVSSTKLMIDLVVDGVLATVQTKTADYTVTVADNGRTFTNTGAAGAVVFSLPAAVPGLKYRFRVGVAQQLRIDPNGTETISLPSTGVPSSAGAYIVADAIGETVDIECVEAGSWSVFGFTGTWTAV